MTERPDKTARPLSKADELRKARLAANLRANLRLRKAQARALGESKPADDATDDPAT